MNNPSKKYREWKKEIDVKEREDTINNNVYVSNDPNDPNNGVYVFVFNVPIIKVIDGNNDTGNTLPIEKVGEFVGNIKRMFRNALNDKAIAYELPHKEADC